MTSDTGTGAVTPVSGRNITFPTTLGCFNISLLSFVIDLINIEIRLTAVAGIPGYPKMKSLFGADSTRINAVDDMFAAVSLIWMLVILT